MSRFLDLIDRLVGRPQRHNRYHSSKPATDLKQPPRGPAPGARGADTTYNHPIPERQPSDG